MILNIIKSIVYNKFMIVQKPSFVTFIPTWRCNCKCVFCDVWRKRNKFLNEMDISQIKKVFRKIGKLDVLRITGGEPFLRSDLDEIINSIDKICNPKVIHITTNGTLPKKILSVVEKIVNKKKIHLKISIDNIGNLHDKVRNHEGAYNKAINSIRELVEYRNESGTNFHLGVNQVIVSEDEISAYYNVKNVLKNYKIPVYPSIAFDSSNALYSNEKVVNPSNSFKTFGKFTKRNLQKIIKLFEVDIRKSSNWQERIINRYRFKGMYNRFVNNVSKPNPSCVALNNHLRLLPNGDIPVCIYNSKIVGNLNETSLKDIWFSEKAISQRKWVKKCPGCWQGCEVGVNSIYSGDFWKGLF